MACETVVDKERRYFCFGCNTTDTVFGPLMWVPESHDIDTVAEDFVKWLGQDPRSIDTSELNSKWNTFYLEEVEGVES